LSVKHFTHHLLHKVNVNTDQDCGNSLADTQFWSVVLGEFIEVKT